MSLHALYAIPAWLLATLICGASITVAVAGMLLTRGWVHEHYNAYRDVVGVYVSSVGVIYAVILGLIAVAAWEDYTELDGVVTREAAQVAGMFRDAEGYPDADRDHLRAWLREYVRTVVEEEWPVMRAGKLCHPSRPVMDSIVSNWVAFEPASTAQAVLHAETSRLLNEVLQYRRVRLQSVDAGLIPALWVVVLVGGLITVGLTYLVATDSMRLDIMLTAGYATMIGLMVFLIMSLDHPFWGQVNIGPEAFLDVMDTMQRLMPIDWHPPTHVTVGC